MAVSALSPIGIGDSAALPRIQATALQSPSVPFLTLRSVQPRAGLQFCLHGAGILVSAQCLAQAIAVFAWITAPATFFGLPAPFLTSVISFWQSNYIDLYLGF